MINFVLSYYFVMRPVCVSVCSQHGRLSRIVQIALTCTIIKTEDEYPNDLMPDEATFLNFGYIM